MANRPDDEQFGPSWRVWMVAIIIVYWIATGAVLALPIHSAGKYLVDALFGVAAGVAGDIAVGSNRSLYVVPGCIVLPFPTTGLLLIGLYAVVGDGSAAAIRLMYELAANALLALTVFLGAALSAFARTRPE